MRYHESKVYSMVYETDRDAAVLFVYDINSKSYEYYNDGPLINTYSMAIGKQN